MPKTPARTPAFCHQRRGSPPRDVLSAAEIALLLEEGCPCPSKSNEPAWKEKSTSNTEAFRLPRPVATAAWLVLGWILILLVYRLALLGGYNPDADCPVPTFDYPDCSNSLMHVGEVAPPLTLDEWVHLRETYHQAMIATGNGARISFADDWQVPNTHGFTDLSTLEFRNSPGKGRAVFAAKPIPKGTKIWDSRYRAVFPDACVAKVYFANMTDQHKCDAMFWGYINNFYGNGVQYMIDLDGHGYINSDKRPNAIHHFEDELERDRYNLYGLRLPWLGIFQLSKADWERRNRPGSYGLYAKQDIQVGEEITYTYDEIFMYDLMHWHTIFIERSLPIWEWFTI